MSAQSQLAAIADAVAEARRAAAEGAIVEVTGLDAAVEQLCLAAKDAAPEERPALLRDLGALAAALDGLAAELARQREAAQRQRAIEAYGDK
jgi:hypothetical protein